MKRTIVIPDVLAPARRLLAPVALLVSRDGDYHDERDVTKPVCIDEHGRPLYAPRGITFRWPGSR